MTLQELLDLLGKHLKLVVALPVACALAMALASFFFMSDVYTATTSMYVLIGSGDAEASSTYTELSSSQMLTNDVAELLESARIEKSVSAQLGLEDLSAYKMSVSSSTTSRVVELSVEGKDPNMAARVASAAATEVSSIAQEVMHVESVNIIDEASTPDTPSGPKRMLYVAVAFLAGLFAAVAIVVLADMLNMTIRSEDELEELTGLPIMGRIPDFGKGGN